MAKIVINEISQNYTYNIGSSSYATVALPITACWGPGSNGIDGTPAKDTSGERYKWTHYASTSQGLESFVSDYRGPASVYKGAKDYSYQIAMTLLSAGYDVLVCRVTPGNAAQAFIPYLPGSITGTRAVKGISSTAITAGGSEAPTINGESVPLTDPDLVSGELVIYPSPADGTAPPKYYRLVAGSGSTSTWQEIATVPYLVVTAKYRGTFGNNLSVRVTRIGSGDRWSLVTYITSPDGGRTAAENITFTLNSSTDDDYLSYYKDVDSNFVALQMVGEVDADPTAGGDFVWLREGNLVLQDLSGGTDVGPDNFAISDTSDILKCKTLLTRAQSLAENRGYTSTTPYYGAYSALIGPQVEGNPNAITDIQYCRQIAYREWIYSAAYFAYDSLKDRLSYNPNRVISPGWDDQCMSDIGSNISVLPQHLSSFHKKLMEVAFYSRCATAYIDIPIDLPKTSIQAYADSLSAARPEVATGDVNGGLFATHSALFAPWGEFRYVTATKMYRSSPSFLALMIQRAQILNQPAQYEWALPTNRKHNLSMGKLSYDINMHMLDEWQQLEGVGVNAITNIPGLGVNIWGNSTLYDVPPATYQALANLSTRLLVNAVENIAYRCGVSITFQYNNDQAYNKFYAGVTPLLDTMKNVGAITDYYVTMNADISGLDQVNANSVIGKIYLTVNGVINDIYIDLIALPPSVDLDQFRS